MIIGIIAAVAGLAAGYFIRKVQISQQVNSVESKVTRALEDAKAREKEILLEAKSKAIEIVEQGKKAEEDFRNQIIKVEDRLSKKENDLERRISAADKLKEEVSSKRAEIEKTKDEMRELKQKQLEQLQKISGLTTEEAKKVLLDATEKSVREEMISLTHKLLSQTREDADKKAREIVSLAIQRCASEVTSEMTTTAVVLPSEEMKGRIIGKEGRMVECIKINLISCLTP